jgi:hypothetical protein
VRVAYRTKVHRRSGKFASSLAAADIRGGALAAESLHLSVVGRSRCLCRYCRQMARCPQVRSIGKWHGTMEWALLLVIGAQCGGRHSAHVHFSRPDHAADAAGEADGCAHQNPEAKPAQESRVS